MTGIALAANLGGVALFTLPGMGLAELLPALRRLPLARRLGYAYLLGVLAVAGGLFAASHLAGVPLRRPAIATLVLVPAVAGAASRFFWAWKRRRPAAGGGEHGAVQAAALGSWLTAGRCWRLAAGVVVAAACLGPLASAVSMPLVDWDGRIFWSAQAAYMRAAATVDAGVLRDPQWFVVHPRYPPLLPLAQVAVQEAWGARDHQQYYRAIYVAFFASLLVVLHDGARRAAGRSAAALAVLCAALPPLASYGSGGATSAYNDQALGAFYGAALVLLLAAPRRRSAGLAAGFLLAAAVLAKNEGQLLAVLALLLAAPRLWRRQGGRLEVVTRRLGWFAAAALPAMAATLLLASWRRAIPNREDEDYFSVLRPSELLHGAWAHLLPVGREAAHLTFEWVQWLGFWALFAAALAAGLGALRRPLARRLLAAGLAPLAIGWAAYCVTSRLPILVDETWDRFLLQAYVPLGIVFACAIRQVWRRGAAAPRRPPPAAVQATAGGGSAASQVV